MTKTRSSIKSRVPAILTRIFVQEAARKGYYLLLAHSGTHTRNQSKMHSTLAVSNSYVATVIIMNIGARMYGVLIISGNNSRQILYYLL